MSCGSDNPAAPDTIAQQPADIQEATDVDDNADSTDNALTPPVGENTEVEESSDEVASAIVAEPEPTTDVSNNEEVVPAESVLIEGSGVVVTDPVVLSEGRWKIEFTLSENEAKGYDGPEPGRITVEIFDRNPSSGLMLIGEDSELGTWTEQVVVENDGFLTLEEGDVWFYIEPESTSAQWALSVESFGGGASAYHAIDQPERDDRHTHLISGVGSAISDSVELTEGVWQVSLAVTDNVYVNMDGVVGEAEYISVEAFSAGDEDAYLISHRVATGNISSYMHVASDGYSIPPGSVWFDIYTRSDTAEWVITVEPLFLTTDD